MLRRHALLVAAMAVGLAFVPGFAARAEERGPVTNLPLPRFVSLKTNRANARRGPSLSHRIDWVFARKGMPLEIIGEYGHWRRVQDRDGLGGWVHYTLLSGARSALVETDLAALYSRADTNGTIAARLEAGVVVSIDRCAVNWCRVRVEGMKGWMVKPDLWGVRPQEVFD